MSAQNWCGFRLGRPDTVSLCRCLQNNIKNGPHKQHKQHKQLPRLLLMITFDSQQGPRLVSTRKPSGSLCFPVTCLFLGKHDGVKRGPVYPGTASVTVHELLLN